MRARTIIAAGALVTALGVLATTVGAERAQAQMRTLRESPQRFALNLRFGPYRPDVDDEFGGDGPFADYFGTSARLLGGFEFDIDIVRIPYVGTAGVGIGLAGTHFGGRARNADNEKTSESAGLTVFPMWATGFVRVDALPRLVSVPLVLTGRLGIENDVWLADGESGTTLGFRWAVALWLELDMFERRAARALDENYGINHSYLTFDVWGATMDGFGDGSSLILSDVSWTLGIGFAI